MLSLKTASLRPSDRLLGLNRSPMSNPPVLRAAVIGLGRMGMNHVRACVDTPGIELAAILDHKPGWAVHVGTETQSLVAPDVSSLFGKVDFAIVAVPTVDHAATAVPLLQQGVSCLVEKPISVSESDAKMMITAAEQGGAVLQVGHIERFNPAICTLHEHLKEGSAVTRIAARRHNSPQDRTYDIDAVLDLMIHDLELLFLFTNQDVSDVRVSSGATEHAVKAGFTIGGAISVELSADRKTGSPVREMIVETEDSIYTVDFTSQQLHRTSQQLHRLTPTGGEEISVEREDALRRQLKAFAKATGSGTVEGATGDDGLTALQLANQIRSMAGLI